MKDIEHILELICKVALYADDPVCVGVWVLNGFVFVQEDVVLPAPHYM